MTAAGGATGAIQAECARRHRREEAPGRDSAFECGSEHALVPYPAPIVRRPTRPCHSGRPHRSTRRIRHPSSQGRAEQSPVCGASSTHSRRALLFGQALIFGTPVERLGGLVERVLEVIVLRVQERFQRDLLGLGDAGPSKKLRARNGFEPNARVLVVDLLAQELERLADAVAPVAQHAGCRGAGLAAPGRSASA